MLCLMIWNEEAKRMSKYLYRLAAGCRVLTRIIIGGLSMKILAQNRNHLYDITGADIFIDCDDLDYMVRLSRDGKIYELGRYHDYSVAGKELLNITKALNEGKGSYTMRFAML